MDTVDPQQAENAKCLGRLVTDLCVVHNTGEEHGQRLAYRTLALTLEPVEPDIYIKDTLGPDRPEPMADHANSMESRPDSDGGWRPMFQRYGRYPRSTCRRARRRPIAGRLGFGQKAGVGTVFATNSRSVKSVGPGGPDHSMIAECEAEFKTERDTPLRAAKPDTGNLGATGHLPVRYFTCPICAVSDVGPTVPPNIDGFHFIQKRKMKDYIASFPRP